MMQRMVVWALVVLVMAMAPGGAAAAERNKIVLWAALGGGLGKVLKEQVDRFNAAQSEVLVDYQFQGDYHATRQKLLAALVAGNTPDVVHLETAFPRLFADQGVLLPLDEFAKGKLGVDLKDYPPGLLEDSTWKGKLYAMPWNRSTPILYYNKQMFKEAGLDPEKPPANMQEAMAAARKLTKREGDRTAVYGLGFRVSFWWAEAWVPGNNAVLSDPETMRLKLNEPGAIEALQPWADLARKDKAIKMHLQIGQAGWENATADFVNARTAMLIESTALLGTVRTGAKFPFGTGFLPNAKRPAAPTGGAGLGILAKAPPEKQEAAWKMLRWLTTPEEAAWVAVRTGYVPVRLSAAKSPEMQDYFHKYPDYKTAVDQLQYAQARPAILMIPKAGDILHNFMVKILTEDVSIKAEAEATVAKLNQEIEEYRKSQKK